MTAHFTRFYKTKCQPSDLSRLRLFVCKQYSTFGVTILRTLLIIENNFIKQKGKISINSLFFKIYTKIEICQHQIYFSLLYLFYEIIFNN